MVLRPSRRLLVDTTEFRSPQREAGIENYGFIEWMKEHPPEDDLKLLRWNDEKLDGKGYVDWYEFEHPQLGKVELGGWDVMYCWGNVPPQFLEAEIAPHSDWALWHLLISPRLEVKSLEVEPIGRRVASGAARAPEHGLAADAGLGQGGRAQGRSPARGRVDAARGR